MPFTAAGKNTITIAAGGEHLDHSVHRGHWLVADAQPSRRGV